MNTTRILTNPEIFKVLSINKSNKRMLEKLQLIFEYWFVIAFCHFVFDILRRLHSIAQSVPVLMSLFILSEALSCHTDTCELPYHQLNKRS